MSLHRIRRNACRQLVCAHIASVKLCSYHVRVACVFYVTVGSTKCSATLVSSTTSNEVDETERTFKNVHARATAHASAQEQQAAPRT